jgi:hypothetical protein
MRHKYAGVHVRLRAAQSDEERSGPLRDEVLRGRFAGRCDPTTAPFHRLSHLTFTPSGCADRRIRRRFSLRRRMAGARWAVVQTPLGERLGPRKSD